MKSLIKLMMVVCLCGVVYGQRDGVPTFIPADTYEVDTINLLTLAPVFNIPILSKNEFLPFGYVETSSQGCSVTGSPSVLVCGSPNGAVFNGYSSGLLGTYVVVTGGTQNGTCPYYSGWYVVSGDGLDYHPVASTYSLYKCSGPSSFTATTIDGSGYTLSVHMTSGVVSGTVTSSSGRNVSVSSFTPSVPSGGQSSSSLSESDSFGNSQSSSAGVYTDSLGVQTLTATNSGLNQIFTQWTDTQGNPQQITWTLVTSQLSINLTGETCASNWYSRAFYPLTSIGYPDGTSVGNITYEPGSGGSGTTTGRIQSFTLRTGGVISYAYNTPCNSAGTTNSLTRTTPDGSTAYTKAVVVQNGSEITYSTTVLDPGKNKTVYYFPVVSGTSYAPVVSEIDRYQNTGTVSSPVYTLLSKDVVCYNGVQTNCRDTDPLYPITQRDTYHTIGAMSTSSRVSETFDSYGNRATVANYDFGASSFTTKTTTTYGSSCGPNANINDLPCDVLTTDGAHNLSETKYTYNSNGAPLSSSRLTGSTWLTTNYTPNATGTIGIVQEPNGQTINIGWDATGTNGGCNGMLPTWTSTVLSGVTLKTSQTWDCNTGLPLVSTDVNGNSPLPNLYDSMLRTSQVTDNLQAYQLSMLYTSNTVSIVPSFGTTSMKFFDGLGRDVVSQHRQTPSSSNYDTVSSSYAFSGPNAQVISSSPCTQTWDTSCTTNFTTSVVNPLGLPISTTDPLGGTLTYVYNKNDASVTVGPAPSGEHVKTIQTEVDGLGRTKSVCTLQTSGGTACGQAMGGSGILDTYSYSFGAGTATTSVTRGTQTHTTTVDALGRPISVTTPESGTTTYYYDSVTTSACGTVTSAGTLLEIKDNIGNYSCFLPDGDGRYTSVGTNIASTSPCKRFAYDNVNGFYGQGSPTGYVGNNLVGRVVEAETDDCTWPTSPAHMLTDEWFSYDADGRMTDMWESTPHSGGYYHTSVAYNPNGTINALNGIPGYDAYTSGVDGEGRPSTASQGTTTIINGVTYDAGSRPLSVLVGTSGDSDTFTYDAVEKMKTYTFSVNGKSDAGVLTWDQDGTLGTLAITDTFNTGGSQTCNFAYDDVARLTDDNCGSTLWHQTYSYDQYDNLTKTGNPGTSWNPGYNTANNEMVGSSYDADGHLLYDGVNTYSWDAYGKLSSARLGNGTPVCGQSGSYCVTYDAFGRIVEASSGSSTYEYLFSPVGRVATTSGATNVFESFLPLPGGPSLKMTGPNGSGTKVIIHKDWLGSGRLGTNFGSRNMAWDAARTPYGEAYATSGTVKQDFTGDLQDIMPGLFDTPNRELATNASRWLSPDPAGASWNAYSYPTNPNISTDPTGLYAGGVGAGFHSCPAYGACGDLTAFDEPYSQALTITIPSSPMSDIIDFFIGQDNNSPSGAQATGALSGEEQFSLLPRGTDALGMIGDFQWPNRDSNAQFQYAGDVAGTLGLHGPLSNGEDWWQRISDTMSAVALLGNGRNVEPRLMPVLEKNPFSINETIDLIDRLSSENGGLTGNGEPLPSQGSDVEFWDKARYRGSHADSWQSKWVSYGNEAPTTSAFYTGSFKPGYAPLDSSVIQHLINLVIGLQ